MTDFLLYPHCELIFGEKGLFEFIDDVQATLSGITIPDHAYVDPAYQQEFMDFFKRGIKMKVDQSRVHRHPNNGPEGYGHCSSSWTPGKGWVAPLGGLGPPKSVNGSFYLENSSRLALPVPQIDLNAYGVEDTNRLRATGVSVRDDHHAANPVPARKTFRGPLGSAPSSATSSQKTTPRLFRSASSSSTSSQKPIDAPTVASAPPQSLIPKPTRALTRPNLSKTPPLVRLGALARPYVASISTKHRHHQPQHPITNPALKRVEKELKDESTRKARIPIRDSLAVPEKGYLGVTSEKVKTEVGNFAPPAQTDVDAAAKAKSSRIHEKVGASYSPKNSINKVNTKTAHDVNMTDSSKKAGRDESCIAHDSHAMLGNTNASERISSKHYFNLSKEAQAMNRKLSKVSQEMNNTLREKVSAGAEHIEEQETQIINASQEATSQSSQDSTYGSQEDPNHHTPIDAFSDDDDDDVEVPTTYSSAGKPRKTLEPGVLRRSTRLSQHGSPAPQAETPTATPPISSSSSSLGKRNRNAKAGSPTPSKRAKAAGGRA